MDSGASKHIISHKNVFLTSEVITPCNVHLDDTNAIKVIGMGSNIVNSTWKVRIINQIRIEGVLHVPKLCANLLYVSKLVSNGLKDQFNLNECIVKSYNGDSIMIVSCKRNLYKINFVKVHKAQVANLVQFQLKIT